MPVRIDALSWVGPTAPGEGVWDHHGDQTGPIPLAGALSGWCRAVAEDRRVMQPLPTVPRMLSFLSTHAEWTAGQPWADEYAEEIHGQWRVGRSLAGVRSERTSVPVPCPYSSCDSMAVYRTPGAQYEYECEERSGGCGTRWTYDEWQAHTKRRAGHLGAA